MYNAEFVLQDVQLVVIIEQLAHTYAHNSQTLLKLFAIEISFGHEDRQVKL